MFDAITTLFKLRWTLQQPQLRPLPPHVQREFVSTQNGDLELLICQPKHPSKATPTTGAPIFFLHGGYGSAGVWLEWMTYLHNAGYPGPLYAFSVRNHGASYSVPYWQMVFSTPLDAVASDAIACIDFIKSHASNTGQATPILVGHSSGGGLAQYMLAKGRARAHALCLVDAIPHFSSMDIYLNWFKHDPWFPLRSMFHLQHPTSPLSTPRLVHGAFFGHLFPMSRVPDFMRWMPGYESMGWPVGMMGDIVGWWRGNANWLEPRDILRNIDLGDAPAANCDKICTIVGSEDMMYDERMWNRQVREYRQGIGDLGSVRLVVVKGAGHHVQNDVQCEKAAEALLKFVLQA
ncbi:alpha/beta-hydrolase [Polychaeton citri CBS 116435]|uniref:Alpha/beta-hydrolase n=1 Tax=Polychaeton citri CBS 116435 TaxID=1314669 RepID=A0A9P4QDZ2_9PEZI|nr:alpha/beta-hydrolase [Polychaeton citri CBS 116435]